MTLRIICVILLLAPLVAEDLPAEIRLGSGASASPQRPFGTGVLGWVGAHRLIEEELKNDPIKIVWHAVQGFGPGVNEGFATGALDIAHYGDFPGLVGKAGRIKTRIVLGGNRGGNVYLVVPTDSAAKTIEDLRGKRVALHKGRPTELPVAIYLDSLDLGADDFRFFNLSPVEGQNAIAARTVDAQFGGDAHLMEANGTGRIIWSTRGRTPHWKSTADIFVTEDFASRYPTTVKRIVKALLRGAHYVSLPEHREEALRFWGQSAASYEILLREWDGEVLAQRYSPLLDDYLLEHYRRSAAIAQKRGLIRGSIAPEAVDAWFDRSFQDAALAELGLENHWERQAADGSYASEAKPAP